MKCRGRNKIIEGKMEVTRITLQENIYIMHNASLYDHIVRSISRHRYKRRLWRAFGVASRAFCLAILHRRVAVLWLIWVAAAETILHTMTEIIAHP
jgi:hypothetical protein